MDDNELNFKASNLNSKDSLFKKGSNEIKLLKEPLAESWKEAIISFDGLRIRHKAIKLLLCNEIVITITKLLVWRRILSECDVLFARNLFFLYYYAI